MTRSGSMHRSFTKCGVELFAAASLLFAGCFGVRSNIIKKRLDTVLLPAMRAHKIDLWLVFTREHNEDPLLSEIGGGWGGVRNAYLFFDRGDRLEKIFIRSHELRDSTIPES